MGRRRLLFRGGMAGTLLAGLLISAQSSQADEWYPGLPDTSFGNWTNGSQGGMSYAKRAKQWFISPMGMAVAEANFIPYPDDTSRQWIRAEGFLVSPTGAPANYGYSEPMTVRSVGFGLMPVEATVQISQRRENGYPSPVRVRLETRTDVRPRPPGDPNPRMIADKTFYETTISDRFNVQILDVKVDGVDIGLNGNCRTVEPAPMVVGSPEYVIYDASRDDEYETEWFRTRDPSTYYHPYRGGQLTGTLTIPPFAGCTTDAGDDLSELLTLAASGPDNPISVRTGWPCPFVVRGANAPAPPGVSNPRLASGHAPDPMLDPRYCPGVKPFEYPEREDR